MNLDAREGDDGLVSIVIPAFNAEKWLPATLDSVIRQDYANWELLIIDDGSTDNTLGIVESYSRMLGKSIRAIPAEHGGQARARNVGVEAARGSFIAFLDSDDLWAPAKLRLQIESLESVRGAIAATCNYVMFRQEVRRPIACVSAPWTAAMLQRWTMLTGYGGLLPSTLLIRSSAAKEIGPFREDLEMHTDLDMAWRVMAHGGIARCDRYLVAYRRHSGQLHRDSGLLMRDQSRLLASPSVGLTAKMRRRSLANSAVLATMRGTKTQSIGTGGAHRWPRLLRSFPFLIQLGSRAASVRIRRWFPGSPQDWRVLVEGGG